MAVSPTTLPSSGLPSTIPTFYLEWPALDITIARLTDANIAAAEDPTGKTEFLEGIINPIGLLTGKISASSTVITGTDTLFNTQVKQNDYLYYYDEYGSPQILGKVSEVVGDTLINLYSAATSNVSDVYFGTSNTVIAVRDTFIMRATTAPGYAANTVVMPALYSYTDQQSGFNVVNLTRATQLSQSGDPFTPYPTGGFNWPAIIKPIVPWPKFRSTDNKEVYFNNTQSFPKYVYFTFNEFYLQQIPSFGVNTLFEIFAKTESIPCIEVALSASIPDVPNVGQGMAFWGYKTT